MLAAFSLWGLLPIYWKALKQIPSLQITSHRIFWAFIFISILLWRQKRWSEFRATFKSKQNRIISLTTALILGSNWFVYIWAVNNDHILDASMGYFINPLISVLLGVIFLRERLNFRKSAAVFLAFLGVTYLTFQYGKIPWIALWLAVTFGVYGLLRKTARIEALVGLSAETALLSPLVLSYLIFQQIKGTGFVGTSSVSLHLLLLGSGFFTAIPLLWFNLGVKKIPLMTTGFLQYLAPSIMLFLGVIVYGEKFTTTHLISFSFIWVAIILYSLPNNKKIVSRKS